jgi:acetylglutamate kinase
MEGDAACAVLAQTVESRKVVLLTAAGGLLDAASKVMHAVNLATDYEDLTSGDDVAAETRERLRAIHGLLQRLPATASVSLVRPQGLAQELFTHGGAGTLVRRGERILALRYWHTVDHNRFEALVQDSFGRSLTDDYFATTPLQAAYFVESYRAGAIVASSLQAPLLDKFMVADDAQGEGLGWAIWRHVVEAHPKLLWRARADNPVNSFYFRQADGSLRRDDWIVFWRGIDDLTTVQAAVDALLQRPASLVRGDVER